MPVHFHIGASLTTMNFFGTYPWESHDDDTKLAIGGTLLFIGNARVVVNIICSGMFDRYPELKIVSVESGTGWVPFILEALDYEMDENAPQAKARAVAAAVGVLQAQDLRDDVVRAHRPRRRSCASVGEDNIMFETDFPHPTCLYPDPLQPGERQHARPERGRAAQDPRRERRRSSTTCSPTADLSTAYSGSPRRGSVPSRRRAAARVERESRRASAGSRTGALRRRTG